MLKLPSIMGGLFVLMFGLLFAFTASAQTSNTLQDLYDSNNLQNNGIESNDVNNDTNTTPGVLDTGTSGTDTQNDANMNTINNTGTGTGTMNTTTPGVPATGGSGDGTGTSTATGTPGAPNTGVGGDSAGTWVMLILSGMLAIGGITYMLTASRSRQGS